MCVICFFFSSRRRHTRCSRDWSSDVCSSDLLRMSAPRRKPLSMRIGRRSPSARTVCGSTSIGATQERSEEHTSELQSRLHLVCRLLLEKKKNKKKENICVESQ